MRCSVRIFPLLTSLLVLAGCQTTPTKSNTPAAMAPEPTQTTARPTGLMEAPTVNFQVGQLDAAANLNSLEFDGKSLYVTPQPVLTRADLSRMTPLKNARGAYFVQFQFNPQGAQKLAALMEQSMGKFFVLSVDGRFAAVSPIGSPVTDGVLNMPVDSQSRAVGLVNSMMLRPAQ